MLDPGGSGRYVLGSGTPGEAAAFLSASPIASALDRYMLDSDPAEEDRLMMVQGAEGTRVFA